MDPQQFLSVLRIPHPNVIQRARREHVRVIARKLDIVDPVVVAGVPQLRVQILRLHPVNIALAGPAEEVSEVPSERNRSHCTQDLTSALDPQRLDIQLADGPVPRTHYDIPVRKQADAPHALRKQFLRRAHSPKRRSFDRDFHHVPR